MGELEEVIGKVDVKSENRSRWTEVNRANRNPAMKELQNYKVLEWTQIKVPKGYTSD